MELISKKEYDKIMKDSRSHTYDMTISYINNKLKEGYSRFSVRDMFQDIGFDEQDDERYKRALIDICREYKNIGHKVILNSSYVNFYYGSMERSDYNK